MLCSWPKIVYSKFLCLRETIGIVPGCDSIKWPRDDVLLSKISRPSTQSLSSMLWCTAMLHITVILSKNSARSRFKPMSARRSYCSTKRPQRQAPNRSSYAKVDENSDVMQIAEKVWICPLANTGVSWFASSTEFVKFGKERCRRMTSSARQGLCFARTRRVFKAKQNRASSVLQNDDYSNIGTSDCLSNTIWVNNEEYFFCSWQYIGRHECRVRLRMAFATCT